MSVQAAEMSVQAVCRQCAGSVGMIMMERRKWFVALYALPTSSHCNTGPSASQCSDSDPGSHNMGHTKLALPVFCLSLFSSSDPA